MSVQYIERYKNRLEGCRFATMRLESNIKEVLNVLTALMDDTAIGVWVKLW